LKDNIIGHNGEKRKFVLLYYYFTRSEGREVSWRRQAIRMNN
jgi:hypothetical protein